MLSLQGQEEVGARDLEETELALERMTLEMGAAILHLEAARDPLLPPDDAREHREQGELHAFFARSYAEQAKPAALAAVVGLRVGKPPRRPGEA